MKPREWRDALGALKSDVTYEDLAKIEFDAKPLSASDKRRRVPIKELVVAENVFQWRGEHSDLLQEESIMRELMRVLELGRGDAANLVSDALGEVGEGLVVQGSPGQGNWAAVPWMRRAQRLP